MVVSEEVIKLEQNDPTITELDFRDRNIGAVEVGYLADALRKNTKLTSLNFKNNKLGARGAMTSLASVLKNNSTLTGLYISNNLLNNESARVLASLLKENSTLIELDLNYNNIGDEGAFEFASALKMNTTLDMLNLWSNNIGDEGARALTDAVRDSNYTITSLNVDQNQIQSKDIRDDLDSLLERNSNKIREANRKTNLHGQRVIGDAAEGKDLLGVEPTARALAQTLVYATLTPPLVLAILGAWGSGKTFTFNLIKKEFGNIQSYDVSDKDSKSPFVGHIYPVTFDVWTYSKGDLMASLMLTILASLNKQLQYEKIIPEKALLKGVNLIELMEIVSESDLKYLQEKGIDKETIKKIKEVAKDDTSNVSEALLDVVIQKRDGDEKKITEKKEKLKELRDQSEARLRASYINKQSNGDRWVCRDKKSQILALLKHGYKRYEKKKKTEEKKKTESNADGSSDDTSFPESAMTVVKELRRSDKLIRLFFAGEMSSSSMAFVFMMIIIAIVLPIVLPYVAGEMDSQRTQLLSIFGPGSIAAITSIVSKIQDANNTIEEVFDEAKCDAKQDGQILLESESGQKYTELQKGLQKKITNVESEISTLNERLWLVKGQPLEKVVSDRLENSGYEKNLGVTHKAKMDIDRISESMLRHKFPRGDPRIVLFVDDLDRCRPDKVVETLEALQLLVKTKLFVVVAAIDARYVTLCLEQSYKGVLQAKGGDHPTGLEYLEKIIQISYRVPTNTEKEYISKYIEHQCPKSSEINRDLSNTGSSDTLEENDIERSIEKSGEKMNAGNEETTDVKFVEKAQERYEEQQLTSKEIETLAQISSELHVNPRAIKRVLNSYKVIKIVSHRSNSQATSNEDTTIAFLVLLTMSASATMRHIVYNVLVKFESKKTDEGNFGTLFDDALEDIERNEVSEDIKTYLAAIKWENKETRSKVREQLGLFRSFALFSDREMGQRE